MAILSFRFGNALSARSYVEASQAHTRAEQILCQQVLVQQVPSQRKSARQRTHTVGDLSLSASSTPSLIAAALLTFAVAQRLPAQMSLSAAVELALRNNPRVQASQANVDKARAALEESRDVYIPSLAAGAGLGQSYGYSTNPPSLFTFNAQSMVYNASQFAYIRSARAGLAAAALSLQDAREAVEEDAALTYVALDRDQRREDALRQQAEHAARLVTIVEERLAAGRDRRIDLTTAQLSAAQLRLSELHAHDETLNDRDHLARLLKVSPDEVRITSSPVPQMVALRSVSASSGVYSSPAVAAAFANAKAKQQIALGDARYLYRPQFTLVAQYNLYATWTNSFKQLQSLYSANTFGANEGAFGVQINVPLFDRFRQAKNRESAAEASRSLREAEAAQASTLEGQSRLAHAIEELRARAEVSSLDQQLAQQQLEIVLEQMKASSAGSGTPTTPKDEQLSHIAEREKYVTMLDVQCQLQQTQINLLRQTGQLEEWLKQTSQAGSNANP